MQEHLSRERAVELLLGKGQAALEAFTSVPPYLRARAARRAAVRCLGEQTRASSLELGALIHAATRDADALVRSGAVSVLSRLLAPGLAAPVLHACAHDADAVVREAAHAALAQLSAEEARVVSLPRPTVVRPAKLPGFIGH